MMTMTGEGSIDGLTPSQTTEMNIHSNTNIFHISTVSFYDKVSLDPGVVLFSFFYLTYVETRTVLCLCGPKSFMGKKKMGKG